MSSLCTPSEGARDSSWAQSDCSGTEDALPILKIRCGGATVKNLRIIIEDEATWSLNPTKMRMKWIVEQQKRRLQAAVLDLAQIFRVMEIAPRERVSLSRLELMATPPVGFR